MFLLDDILFAPARGLFSIFQAIAEQAQKESCDQRGLRQELLRLQRFRISDEAQREALEASLLSSLVSANRRLQR